MTSFIECLFVEIRISRSQIIIIGSVYKPPNTNLDLFNAEWVSILNAIDQFKNTIVLIAGDFNLNLLKHNHHGPTGEFFNNLLLYNFVPTISVPTRVSLTSATLIDNIFLNCLKYMYDSAIVYM